MKNRTMNMFAVTNEDLPLFSGATVAAEVAEFVPVEQPAEVKPLPMFHHEIAMLYTHSGGIAYTRQCTIEQQVQRYAKQYGTCTMTTRQDAQWGTIFEMHFNYTNGEPCQIDWVIYS